MKDSDHEKWEPNEVSSTIAPVYCLEFQPMAQKSEPPGIQADTLTSGDVIRIPGDRVLRVYKTEERRQLHRDRERDLQKVLL